MRNLLFVLFILLLSGPAVAQNATLTKGETAEYLKKKVEEIDQHVAGASGSHFVHPGLSFSKDHLAIKFCFKSKTSFKCYTYTFNPLYIKEVTLSQKNATTAYAVIRLVSKSGVVKTEYSSDAGNTSSDEMWLPFVVGDGKNFDKIKRALLHLQALLKAEDDPFGG